MRKAPDKQDHYWKKQRFYLIRNMAYLAAGALLLALVIVQTFKYRIEMRRLDVERERIVHPAPGPAPTPAPVAQVPPVVPPSVAGTDALRGLIEVLPAVVPAAKAGKRGMLEDLVSGVTQGLVKAGKATVKEANTLRAKIIDAAINVGEDAAKEVIRSFLREKEGDKPAAADKTSVGGVGNHVEITFNGQKEYLPPRVIIQPAPKSKPAPCSPPADSKPGSKQEPLCSAPPAMSTSPATSAASATPGAACPACQTTGH